MIAHLVPKYRMLIDESGNHHITEKAFKHPANHHLCLLGCIVEQGAAQDKLTEMMEDRKERFFPDATKPVIFHREHLLNAMPPFGSLVDPAFRRVFDESMLEMYRDASYRLVATMIYKPFYKSLYPDDQWHPYHDCMEVLIDRFVLFLKRRKAVGDVYAETRGKKEDRELDKAWREFRDKGTTFTTADDMNKVFTSKDIHIKPKSANLSGMQLSDLLVTNVARGIMVERKIMPMFADPFGRRVCKTVSPKFDGKASWSRIYLPQHAQGEWQ